MGLIKKEGDGIEGKRQTGLVWREREREGFELIRTHINLFNCHSIKAHLSLTWIQIKQTLLLHMLQLVHHKIEVFCLKVYVNA